MMAPITIIIGLGNPGKQYQRTRHNIGFLVADALVEKHGGSWEHKKDMDVANIVIGGKNMSVIKPQTFMNSSGRVIPQVVKQNNKVENVLVIHDELEKAFGKLDFKTGGSHRGHNGLRSIIEACGPNFMRLRFGVGRPDNKEDVSDYVLSNFDQKEDIEPLIDQAVSMVESLY